MFDLGRLFANNLFLPDIPARFLDRQNDIVPVPGFTQIAVQHFAVNQSHNRIQIGKAGQKDFETRRGAGMGFQQKSISVHARHPLVRDYDCNRSVFCKDIVYQYESSCRTVHYFDRIIGKK
jgi:hypothetical protein